MADGVFDDPVAAGFMDYRDDAYLRDGLGLLVACEAMLFGRRTYETFAKAWPGRVHPWADRLNTIPKYVFSSTLEKAEWANSTLVRGDAAAEVTKLKQQEGGDLLIFGHGLLGETLPRERLTDVIDLSVHPLLLGRGKQFFREGLWGARPLSWSLTCNVMPGPVAVMRPARTRGSARRGPCGVVSAPWLGR